jgi:hypothetical protein
METIQAPFIIHQSGCFAWRKSLRSNIPFCILMSLKNGKEQDGNSAK